MFSRWHYFFFSGTITQKAATRLPSFTFACDGVEGALCDASPDVPVLTSCASAAAGGLAGGGGGKSGRVAAGAAGAGGRAGAGAGVADGGAAAGGAGASAASNGGSANKTPARIKRTITPHLILSVLNAQSFQLHPKP